MQDFDFVCRCDCENHPKYPNILAVTGFFLIVPALLFWCHGMFFFAFLSAVSALTSVVYHTYHLPIIKIADVFVVYSLACTGTFSSIRILLERRSKFALFALFLTVLIVCINNCQLFRIGERTAVKFHVVLHLLSISALICVCLSRQWVDF